MKLVSKLNRGVVDVSTEYSKVLLARKSEWAKEVDFLKEEAEQEVETA